MKDEPRMWQRRKRMKRRWRRQKGACEEFVRMRLNWQKNSRCWNCFLNLSLLRMKMRKKRKYMEVV